MSILIKGMAKPRNCDACFFYTEKCGGICRISNGNGCPIVEVPPHGRLIDSDADRLKDEIWKLRAFKTRSDVQELIDSAPTVIPAQENPSSYIKRSNKPTEEPERPTAEWEDVTELPVKIEGELPEFSPVKIASMRCSACRQYQVKVYFYGNSEDNSLYCGFCGAKMKGVKTDDRA